jgi:hypothetical protein
LTNQSSWLKKRISPGLLSLILFTSCNKVDDSIEPKIHYTIHEKMVQDLPCAFEPLHQDELEKAWATEYRMGIYFARKLDLYRAITAFNRAEFLLTEEPHKLTASLRKHEVEYMTLLCYALGKRYDDLISYFENSTLTYVTADFKPYHDLLVILSEAYEVTKQKHKALSVQQALAHAYPAAAEKFFVGQAVQIADMQTAFMILDHKVNAATPASISIQKALNEKAKPYNFINFEMVDKTQSTKLKDAIDTQHVAYQKQKKSPFTAQLLGSIVPGAGYAYLGQYQSAFTAFSVNALFIGTASYFFLQGNIPAGILTTSFEAGWYFGSIYGSGQACKTYNERLFESYVGPVMDDKKLHPLLQIEYGF